MDEFQIIKKYFKKIIKNNNSALNLNDDVFYDKSKNLVVSVDKYVEGVHYVNFNSPNLLIKKIIRSSISDLICKGVKPKYIFLAAGGNKNTFNKKNLELISNSIKQEQRKFSIKLSGGDMVFSKNSTFTVTSIGYSSKIVKRNNAKKNDDIYVTGNLGDSYLGLQILKKKLYLKNKYNKYFIDKYFLPDLPTKLQKYFNQIANCSIDISDGLFSDLKKLINNQNYGYNIDLDLVPISKNLKILIKDKKLNKLNYISKGDDYQVLFTAEKKDRQFIKSLSKRINHKITLIGEINNKSKDCNVFQNNNLLKTINYKGYLHTF